MTESEHTSCRFCGDEGWVGGELEPRRPCTGCNAEARATAIADLTAERDDIDRRLSELGGRAMNQPDPLPRPAMPWHMRFVGGTIYCSVKQGRLNLGGDHRYADAFTCPACGTYVPPRGEQSR